MSTILSITSLIFVFMSGVTVFYSDGDIDMIRSILYIICAFVVIIIKELVEINSRIKKTIK